MRDFIRELPSLWPLIVVWVVLGAALARPLARQLGSHIGPVFGALMSLGLILLATLRPNDVVTTDSLETLCDLSRVTPPSLELLVTDRDALRNILLFLPLGFFLGLLARNRRALAVIIAAFGLTVMVELSQIALAEVGRGCESADMVDNTIGLAIGLLLGTLASIVYSRYLRSRSQDGG